MVIPSHRKKVSSLPGNWTPITSNQGKDFHSSFSPDGSKIVFDSNRSGHYEIYVYDVQSKNTTQLTNNSFKSDHPHWSFNGRSIIYNSFESGKNDLLKISLDGKNKLKLIEDSIESSNGLMSPDGKQIAFLYMIGSKYELYVADANGQSIKPITHNAINDVHSHGHPTLLTHDQFVAAQSTCYLTFASGQTR
jgi:Tol biopolymer transport system component